MQMFRSEIKKLTNGFLLGFNDPTIQVSFHSDKSINHQTITNLIQLLQNINQKPFSLPQANKGIIIPLIFCRLIDSFYKQANMPVFSQSAISLVQINHSAEQVLLDIPRPIFSVPSGLHIIQACTELMNLVATSPDKQKIQMHLSKIVQAQRIFLPIGKNVSRILNSAHRLNIPIYHLHSNTFQLGMGRFGRWLDSSISDATAQISLDIANNKAICSTFLRKCGFPVAQHILCKKEEEVIKAAEKLGFPIVIKPLDRDRGDGVTADIRDQKRLLPAFLRAQKNKQPVMLEKFYEGRDYRLQVVNGIVYWATNRSSAGVYGDGIHSIKELIHIENTKRVNSPVLKNIQLDEEAYELIEQQALSIDDIPSNNHFIKLKSAANVDKGGYRVPVDLSVIHKDNIQLAIDVANALQLDIAGIDLITPDITQSWKTSPSIICEVNGRPMIGEEAIETFLKNIILGNGRIPITLIVGECDTQMLTSLMSDELSIDIKISMISPDGIWINGSQVTSMNQGVFNQSLELLLKRETENLIVNIKSMSELMDGFAFNRVTNLVLANPLKSIIENKSVLEKLLSIADDKVYLFSDNIKLMNEKIIHHPSKDFSITLIRKVIMSSHDNQMNIESKG